MGVCGIVTEPVLLLLTLAACLILGYGLHAWKSRSRRKRHGW